MSMFVYVCLSARDHFRNHMTKLYQIFLRMLPVTVAGSSSGAIAIRCASGFVDDVIMARIGDAKKHRPTHKLTHEGGERMFRLASNSVTSILADCDIN